MLPKIGIVVIGRNEGQRLLRCLRSISSNATAVIYVDSASTDGSPAIAMQEGVDVIGLDMSVPFSAGRARNAGFARLLELNPELDYVQFVDGDCELASDWLGVSARKLVLEPDVAAVCGRRRERHPEASRFNWLCDLEWDTPVGYTDATGGDFMIRVVAFKSVRGFDERLIAGEEPELGHRLRLGGWKLVRVDHEMTIHDAAMYRWSQWFRRNMRGGFAYAARAWLHLGDGTRYCYRENLSIAVWGGLVPISVAPLAATVGLLGPLLPIALVGIQTIRLATQARPRLGSRDSVVYACLILGGKVPEFLGQLRFVWRALRRGPQMIIEYK